MKKSLLGVQTDKDQNQCIGSAIKHVQNEKCNIKNRVQRQNRDIAGNWGTQRNKHNKGTKTEESKLTQLHTEAQQE